MPKVIVAKKTPEIKKALDYGLVDLIKDLGKKTKQKITKKSAINFKNPVSKTWEGLAKETQEKLSEAFLAAESGGLTKLRGIAEALVDIRKVRKSLDATIPSFDNYTRDMVNKRLSMLLTQLTTIPQGSYTALKRVKIDPNLNVLGRFDQYKKAVLLNPSWADKFTPAHEFTHADLWNPSITRKSRSNYLVALREQMFEKARRLNIPEDELYKIDPAELQAYSVTRDLAKVPFNKRQKMYSKLTKKYLNDDNIALLAETFLGQHGKTAKMTVIEALKDKMFFHPQRAVGK